MSLGSVNDSPHLWLREPSLLDFGNLGQGRVPRTFRFIVLLSVPVHNRSELLPLIVYGLRFQTDLLQTCDPFVYGACLDRVKSQSAEERTQMLRNLFGCGVPCAHFQFWKAFQFPRIGYTVESQSWNCGHRQPLKEVRIIQTFLLYDVQQFFSCFGLGHL